MEVPDLPPSPRVRVRPARDEDLDRLVTVHAAAFPDARNRDARRRNFTENARGSFSDLWVAEVDRTVVGHCFLFRLTTWIAGRQMPVGGVASLGVAPEARGRGVARGILRTVEQELRDRGTALCLLYPFRHRFYRRLGYGLVSEVRRLRVPPEAFPDGPAEIDVSPASAAEDGAAVRRCYQRVAARCNGMLGRNDAVWRAILSVDGRQLSVVRNGDGEVRAYVLYQYLTSPDALPQELDVIELVAADDDARRALWGFLGAQRDQVPCVRMITDASDPILAVLDEPRGPYPQAIRSLIPVCGEVGAGAMLALVDPAAALRTRGWRCDGRIALRVRTGDDEIVLSLDVREGVPQVDQGGRGPFLRLDGPTLAQVYTGFLRPTEAVRIGAATADEETARLADRLFATGAPFFPLDVF